MQQERIHYRNDLPVLKGDYVLYWMQQSQRARYNHALEYAASRANSLGLPLVVFFGITPRYPEGRRRHYRFMIQGLKDTAERLARRKIPFVVQVTDPVAGALALSEKAALVVTDRGYTRVQCTWRKKLADALSCRFVEVESDVLVPVEAASFKGEYSAATLRRKITPLLSSYMVPVEEEEVLVRAPSLSFSSVSLDETESLLDELKLPRDDDAAVSLAGGTTEAEKLLDDFIKNKLKFYDTLRNDPARDFASHMSPYLHFGQVSSLYIALRVMRSGFSAAEKYCDELIVRRELGVNFLHYNEKYDDCDGLPAWAVKTLEKHAHDERPYLYTFKEFEGAATHDPCWNAAQKELVLTGTMQGYMRMYWGKKIIEWTPHPRDAFDIMVSLNNRYALDGRDPNSYAGIAWCLGRHDRPWKERPVFGMVRYMNEKGLRRKFKIDDYIERINRL